VRVPPEEPTGEINLTDPDSRNMLAARGFVQGYNARAAVNEQHVVTAVQDVVASREDVQVVRRAVGAVRGALIADRVYHHPGARGGFLAVT
jgi:hypothetical protein